MKPVLYILALTAIAGGLLTFVAGVLKTPGERPQSIEAQFEALQAKWDRDQTDPESRIVSFVLLDASAGFDLLDLSAVSERAENWWSRMTTRVAKLFRRSDSEYYSMSRKALGDDGASILWVFDGFSVGDEREVIRRLGSILAKAHGSGARIHVVAHGNAAAAALKTIENLSNSSGSLDPPQIATLVNLGVDETAIKKMDPVYFQKLQRPRHLQLMLNLFSDNRAVPESTAAEVYDELRNRERIEAAGFDMLNRQIRETRCESEDSRFMRSCQELRDWSKQIGKALQDILEAERKKKAGGGKKQRSDGKSLVAPTPKPDPSYKPIGNPFPARAREDVDGFGRTIAERETAVRVLGGSASAMDGKRGMYAVGGAGRPEAEASVGKPELGKRAGADEKSSLDMLRSANEMKLSDDEKPPAPSSTKQGTDLQASDPQASAPIKRGKLSWQAPQQPTLSNLDRQAESDKTYGMGGRGGGKKPSKSALDQLCAANGKNPNCVAR